MPFSTPAANAAQLARAGTIGRILRQRGWTRRDDRLSNHPGAHRATLWTASTSPGLTLLVLTIGGKHGQITELLGPATDLAAPDRSGRQRRDRRPSWRLTCYDAPAWAVAAAALTAADAPPDAGSLAEAGWNITHHQADDRRRPVLTEFTRPDKAISAAFRIPTFTPPCNRCPPSGDLGDSGGWLLTGPGFAADATAHTPTPVITAFALALPGGEPGYIAKLCASTNPPTPKAVT